MPEPFDPYATWLGIAPEDRPLTAYRLLGIEPSESDVRVITEAAETRLREVERQADRAHAETAKRLSQQILAARNKLLRAVAKPADAAQAKPSQSTHPQSEATGEPTIAVSARQAALRTAPPRTWLQRFLANPFAGTVLGGVIAGVIYLGIVWWTGGGTDSAATPASDPVATEQRPAAVAKAVDLPPETAASSPQASDDDGTEEPGLLDPTELSEAPARITATSPPIDTSQTLPGPDEASETAATPIPLSNAASPSDGPGAAATGEAVEKNGPENPAGEADVPPSTLDEPVAAQEKDKRRAVPDEADQREAEKEVRKLLRDDFAAARTPEQSLGLARSLLKLAAETGSDLAVRYVLLHMAEERAADGGDLALACEAVDKIAAEYDVEPWARKADALERVLEVARSVRGPTPIGHKALECAGALVAEALEADQYRVARQMTATVLTAARRAKNTSLANELSKREQEIRRLEAAFAIFQNAQAALANDPNDTKANLTAGRWHGFVKGDWRKAMPLLAKGSDVLLARVAQDDLAQPTKPEAQVELANAWWDQCLKETGPTRSMAARRAVFWYDQALNKLTGLPKLDAGRSRLEALSTVADPNAPSVVGAVEDGNVALASNGTTLSAKKTLNPQYFLDGTTAAGAAVPYSKFPCEWTIIFSTVYRLQEVRLYLYLADRYSFHYGIATSADGRTYLLLTERTSDSTRRFDRITFPARPVKAIKLTGIASTNPSNTFDVCEFEAYCIPPDVASDKEP